MPLAPTSYATFVGIISQDSAGRAIYNINMMSQGGVRELHVMFQSFGGAIGDGVALFNYFRAAPIALHFYNAGTLESAGVIAFMGAPNRYVSAHGTFMIHRSTLTTPTPLKAGDMLARGKSLNIDDARSREILKSTTTLPQNILASYVDETFVAEEAVKFGIAQQVREFQVPAGDQVLDLTYRAN